jgi:hypothetical protein
VTLPAVKILPSPILNVAQLVGPYTRLGPRTEVGGSVAVRVNLYSVLRAHIHLARGHGIVDILANVSQVGAEVEGIDSIALVQPLMGTGDRGDSARRLA